MRKADSLRRWLTAYIPDMKTHPDRMQIYVEGGTIASRQSRTLSYVYQYTLKVLICDFAGDTDTLMVPVLAWIAKEQPQLLRRQDSAPFTFEAELLDSETSDIEISIDLTENRVVTARPNGSGYDIERPEEPSFVDAFEGVNASFSGIFAGHETLVPDPGV
ncbi:MULTISPECIES: phage tail protein [unclassified Novosphingobium]|uniref:phage tail protein n=1 Tax=unclassified Novosphingobium TaxID=2644732 RepID=UPI00135A3034|nr:MULTISPECIES: phage tail protein [unclassified Novosphingobium]